MERKNALLKEATVLDMILMEDEASWGIGKYGAFRLHQSSTLANKLDRQLTIGQRGGVLCPEMTDWRLE